MSHINCLIIILICFCIANPSYASRFRETGNYTVSLDDSSSFQSPSVMINNGKLVFKNSSGGWSKCELSNVVLIQDEIGRILYPNWEDNDNNETNMLLIGAAEDLNRYARYYYFGIIFSLVGSAALYVGQNDDIVSLKNVGYAGLLFGTAFMLGAPLQVSRAGDKIRSYAASREQ